MYVGVYTKSGCLHCNLLKNWLEKKGVIYNEKPIEIDKYCNEFLDHKGTGFPFTVVKVEDEEKLFLGNSPKLKKYLNEKHPLI